MKTIYTPLKTIIILLSSLLSLSQGLTAQSCATAQGDQTTYGTSNIWIGYVYTGMNFNNYMGYVNEGSAGNSNFNEGFGGGGVTYNTHGCSITTDNFSVRYKLTQTFASGDYTFTVGGDDGYRFSLDGGATWIINKWNDQSYNTTSYSIVLNGTYNMVLEYYQNGGANEVSFNVAQVCMGTGDPSVYGTGNVWNGYLYQGMGFDIYKGSVTEGSASNPAFDESFGNPGGSNSATYNTSSCSVTTYQFSARYRLRQVLPPATYVITVGGDDGYRLSLDAGNTYPISNWGDHAYATTTYTAFLSGTYSMVLDYYDNGGFDRVSFVMTSSTLPVTLTNWSVSTVPNAPDETLLKWQATNAVNFDHYIVQRSTDGITFQDVHTTPAATANGSAAQSYSYTDRFAWSGAVYYRLLMVDLDGSMTYSNILSLELHTSQPARIYPTVVENGNLMVESSSPVHQARLEIFDMSGHRIQENNWSLLDGRQPVTLNGNRGSLPAGTYIVRLSDNSSVLAKQIILIK